MDKQIEGCKKILLLLELKCLLTNMINLRCYISWNKVNLLIILFFG